MATVPNDISAVIEADRAHIWHHLIQHKPFETVDPRVMVEGKGMRVWDHKGKAYLDAVNAKVISIVVTDLNENTYFAKIHLTYEDSEYTIDSRPSDAIALALRSQAPIFVNESVIKKQSTEEFDQWLENLKPEDFGKLDS